MKQDIETIRKKLACDAALRERAAEATGIPLQTVRNFAVGITRFPRYDTIAPLLEFMRGVR
jgi:hypothetical protein